MGIYEIQLGKGIIVPVAIFVYKHRAYIKTTYEDGDDELETLISVVHHVYGEEYTASPLGHDAFQSRHSNKNGAMQMLVGNNEQAIKQVNRLRKKLTKPQYKDLPFDSLGCGDLMFIGYHKTVEAEDNAEFEYYVKVSELLYGLPSLLDGLIEAYIEMKTKECLKLVGEFGQQPCIWTFATDCACCG